MDNVRPEELKELIAKRELALQAAEVEYERCLENSDRGWLLTIGSKEAGTYMAVSAAKEARKWKSLIETLKENIKELRKEQL